MKLYIDDVRFPPDDTRDDTITSYIKVGKIKAGVNQLLFRIMLNLEQIEEISFDYDLSDEGEFNGYELMIIVLQYYKLINYKLPKISIHSVNPVGVTRMEKLLEEYAYLYNN